MTSDAPPVELFQSELAAPDRVGSDDVAALSEALQEQLSKAQAAWPQVLQPPDSFVRYLAQRVPEGEPIVPALRRLRAADLYLACACARGMRVALDAFEVAYFSDVDGALRHMGVPATIADELKQTLRCELFVGDGDALPLITDYLGRGDLRSWVRTVATRAALKMLRKERGHAGVGDEEMLAAMASPDEDPVLLHLKQTYAGDFRWALREALALLSRRERNLARQHFIDGLTIDELASLYKVHRATTARWIIKVRERLLERTQRLLMERLRLGRPELQSLMRLVRSQLDVSIHHLLAPQR